MKNDIDEGFVDIQNKMKGSLVELLIAAMEKRYKAKPKTYIRFLIEKALRGKISKTVAYDLVTIIFGHDETQKFRLFEKIRANQVPEALLSESWAKQRRRRNQGRGSGELHPLQRLHGHHPPAQARLPRELPS